MIDRQRHPLWTLLLLTLVAGVLRFSYLDRPAIWGDESETWRRISGSYQQMVDQLRVAGFMPGNYVLTWWIKEGFPISGEYKPGPPADREDRGFGGWGGRESTAPRMVFTPTYRLIEDGIEPTPPVMRFLPALCGTLMVPAMYFLASRLVARRTALLAAVFTCFSAYLLNYSRDAKMYVQFWFFATLHIGCLLWWLDAYRKSDPAPLPAHMIDDGVVEGVHSILPESHITQIGDAFITKPAKRPARPLSYPSRLETAVRWMCWLTSGLAMIAFNAIGLGVVGVEVLIFLATMPLRTNWPLSLGRAMSSALPYYLRRSARMPKEPPTGPAIVPPKPIRLREPFRLLVPPIVGFAIGVAAVASLWWSYKDFTRFYERVNPNDEIARMDLGDAGISWVEPYNEGRTARSYFLYNATAYLMNWEWVKPDQIADVDARALKLLRWSSASLLIAIGAGIVPWRKLISKRPANPAILRGRTPLTSAFVVCCWLLLPAYGFYCASGAWSDDGDSVRAAAPTQALLASLFPNAGNDDVHRLAGALGAELSGSRRARGWTDYNWRELFIVHGLRLSEIRWWVIAAVLGTAALMLLDRWHSAREKLRIALWVVGLLSIFWILAILTYVFTPVQSGSIWMPRYLGFVWPAFAIAASVLIRRLPFALVRYGVVLALIGTNLTVFYYRCNLGEPRTDLFAQDYRVARDSDAIRLFSRSEGSRWRGAPGYGSMVSMPSVYYVTLQTHQPVTPTSARAMMRRSLDLDPLPGDFAGGIRVRLRRDAKADEFYLWVERPVDDETDLAARLHDSLGADWSAADAPLQWTIYDHWTWRRIYRLERHHWKRSASTQPATTSSNQPSAG